MHDISHNIVVETTCRHFWPCRLNVVKKNFHFYLCRLVSVIMSDNMSSEFLGRTILSVNMSSDFLGRTTCWSTCHPNFSVGRHVAQNVVHDNILLILMTGRDIWPKSTTFLGLILVISDDISRRYLGRLNYVVRHVVSYWHCRKYYVIGCVMLYKHFHKYFFKNVML